MSKMLKPSVGVNNKHKLVSEIVLAKNARVIFFWSIAFVKLTQEKPGIYGHTVLKSLNQPGT